MADDRKVKGFPDISSKLSAPAKKSLFERQKAEAEAKRAREQAETAAVYEDFVKSFDDDGNAPSRPTGTGRPNAFAQGPSLGGFAGGPAKRHFTSGAPRNSGPGSLGPPPPSISRKRNFDGFHRDRDSGPGGIFGFDSPTNQNDPVSALQGLDDESDRDADAKVAERAAPKPTLHLSSLAPGMSQAAIKALIPPSLVVDSVKILPSAGQKTTERKTWSAIVTLAQDTAATDMDTAVSSLQNRYLGWGHYLSISRHLSSVAINSAMPVTSSLSSASSLPFGARPIPQGPSGFGRGHAGGPHRGGFAPPSSYGPGYGRSGPTLQVEVKPPSDIKQLRLIHKTLENLLTYGPEFEALLMSRTDVQKQEKWAWLWNSRSAGGVWYRWKLWEILTGSQSSEKGRGRNNNAAASIFEGDTLWKAPQAGLRFEYTTQMEEFVSDEDYDSSDEEDSDREDERRRHGADGPDSANPDGIGYMTPLQKAKLTHLLARLPTSNARLRKGDIARTTAFAIDHAGAGAEEVVDIIVSNVLNPLAFTGANPDRLRTSAEHGIGNSEPPEENTGSEYPAGPGGQPKGKTDLSAAKLVGLFVISDILSSSSTSGVRHAWRYRQLFESTLKSKGVFEHLGRMEKDLSWGRLKAEKWKRSIGNILTLWEGWCVFPQSSQEHFVQVFEKPPLTAKELAEEKARQEADKAAGAFGGKGKSRWKTVDENASAETAKVDFTTKPGEIDSQKMDIDDGVAMADDDDLDGIPMDDIDGVPMEDSDMEDGDGALLEMDEGNESAGEDSRGKEEELKSGLSSEPRAEGTSGEGEGSSRPARRPRPKAEDMFADSDED